MPAKETIKLLSLLNVYIFTYSSTQYERVAQLNHAKDLLGPIECSKVSSLLRNRDEYIFLTELQLLNVMRLFLLKSPKGGELDRNKLGNILLIQNDYNDKTDAERRSLRRTDLLGFIIRQQFASLHDDARVVISRSYFIINEVAQRLKDDTDFIDLEYIFERAKGISFIKYVAAYLAFYSHWHVPEDVPSKKISPIAINTYFTSTSLKSGEVAAVIDDCALEYGKYIEHIRNETKDIKRAQYDLKTFSETPLVLIDNQLYPVSLRLLINKLGHHLYWTFFEYFKRQGNLELNKFFRLFGKIYESYANELLGLVVKDIHSNIRLKGEHSLEGPEIDILIREANTLIIFEVKSSRLTIPALKSGEYKLFKQGLEQTIIKPAKQLSQNIDRLLKNEFAVQLDLNEIEKIYPVILHYYPFPTEILVYDEIEKEMKKYNYLQQNKVAPLTIMDVESLEHSLQQISSIGIASLLSRKVENFKIISFTNYLYYNYDLSVLNLDLKKRWDEVSSLIIKAITPMQQ